MKLLGLIRYYSLYLYYLIVGRKDLVWKYYRKYAKNFSLDDSKLVLFSGGSEEGKLAIHNNSWGSYKLKTKEYLQYILRNKGEYGWLFNPPLNQKGVLGYPAIVHGGSGWGMLTKSDCFPIEVYKLHEFKIYFDIKLITDKLKHNLTFDFWIVDRVTGTKLCEIMVWEDYQVARPYGKRKSSKGEYIITSGYLDKTHEPNDEIGWDFVAFRRKRRRTKGEINVLKLLNEAVSCGAIPQSYLKENIMGVELGTEVYSSVGLCIVEEFNISTKF